LIFIFLFVAHSTDAAILTDSLALRKEAQTKALEYEYQYFKATDNSVKTICLINEAACYSNIGDFRHAAEILDRVDFSSLPDTLQREVHKKLAYASYLDEDFEKAESHLLRYEAIALDSAQLVPLLPLYALVLNELSRWDESRSKLETYVKKTTLVEKELALKTVSLIYSDKNYPRTKSLRKAQIMSAFFPGLGQMYSGYFWDGVTSFALVTGTAAFTVYSVITAHYFTAAIIGYGLATKFYQGGIKHLEYLVGKTNYARTRSYNDLLKQEITELVKKAGNY
jgi:TM2 domain-containing membrane protein YozV